MSKPQKRSKHVRIVTGVKVGELIDKLQKYDRRMPVMILIPTREDSPQWEFVTELEHVVDHEYNEGPDSPMLVTKYWHRAVGEQIGA